MNTVFFVRLALGMSLCLSAMAGEPAVETLQKQAELGDAAAQFQLGRLYFRGDGVTKNEKLALEWIGKSAEQQNTDAITSMGFFYSQGVIVPRDEAKAVEWFRRGADAGSPRCKLNLGLLLRQGKSIQLSNGESLRLMQEAADAGLPEAQSYLGQLYFLGDALLMPDYAKAEPYARKAAESGVAAAQNIMGLLTRDGIGPGAEGKDPVQAEKWFRRAAEQNDVKAQANLAHLMGVASPASTNRVEALQWLLLAKDREEPTAVKTYNEISPSLPAGMEQEARGLCARFLVKQAARQAAKDQQPVQPR